MTSGDLPDRGEQSEQSVRAQFDDAVCVVGTHLRMQDALADLAGNPLDGTRAGVVESLLLHQVPRARAALRRLVPATVPADGPDESTIEQHIATIHRVQDEMHRRNEAIRSGDAR